MSKLDELAALVDGLPPAWWIDESADDTPVGYVAISSPEHGSLALVVESMEESTYRLPYAAAIVALRNHADALLAVARAAKAQQYARKQVADNPGIASYVRALDAADGAIGDALDRL